MLSRLPKGLADFSNNLAHKKKQQQKTALPFPFGQNDFCLLYEIRLFVFVTMLFDDIPMTLCETGKGEKNGFSHHVQPPVN